MSTSKRKTLDSELLRRRVRARREASEEPVSEETEQSVNGEGRESSDSQSTENDDESDSSDSQKSEEASSISFGALAKAQASLSDHGKTKSGRKLPDADGDTWDNNEAVERKAGWKDHRDFNRSSKHAPTEISSKKAVSRKREVVPVAKREFRDPRFENMNGEVDESKIRRAYSFLDEYREDEMKELKDAIKTTKDEDAKEKLKRTLLSMESRKMAQIRKDKQRDVLDRHRKVEKELVKQGKQPFYLKTAEQKKRVLLGQFVDLQGKQLDRVIERRRKKVEGKEKKKIPFARRGMEP